MSSQGMRFEDLPELAWPRHEIIDGSRVAADAQSGTSLRREDVYLTAELMSPSSCVTDLNLKRQLYAEWGIGSYWVLDPLTREVHEFGLRESATCWLADVDLSDI
jgi:Uma2 family endonuclease